PVVDRAAQLRLAAQTGREAELREPEAEAREQLAQRPQALQLGGPVEPVATGRAAQLEHPGALDVAQHARRPSGRLRSLVDRQSVHRAPPYHSYVKVCPNGSRATARGAPACARTPAQAGATTSIQSSERPHNSDLACAGCALM